MLIAQVRLRAAQRPVMMKPLQRNGGCYGLIRRWSWGGGAVGGVLIQPPDEPVALFALLHKSAPPMSPLLDFL